jgi:hypothetical protein
MQGRDTPSPGLDKTAQFIADNLKKLKLKPMGDKGSYFSTSRSRRPKLTASTRPRSSASARSARRGLPPNGARERRGRGAESSTRATAGSSSRRTSTRTRAWTCATRSWSSRATASRPRRATTLEELKGKPGGWETPISYAEKARREGARPRPAQLRAALALRRAYSIARPSFAVARLQGLSDEDEQDETEEQQRRGS